MSAPDVWLVQVGGRNFAVSVVDELDALEKARKTAFAFKGFHEATIGRFDGKDALEKAKALASEYQNHRLLNHKRKGGNNGK